MDNDELLFVILAKDKEYCLNYYLECLLNQTLVKSKIHLYIRTNDNTDNTINILLGFLSKYGNDYASVYFNHKSVDDRLKLEENKSWNSFRFKILGKIRQESIDYAIKNKLHYFIADVDNFIRPHTLEYMLKYKKKLAIAPMLKSATCYSNFHNECDKNGYLKNNPRYYDLYFYKQKGLIPVELIHCTYFINYNVLNKVFYDDNSNRYEYVIFSESLRKSNITQYLANDKDYGIISLARSREGVCRNVNDILKKHSLTPFFNM